MKFKNLKTNILAYRMDKYLRKVKKNNAYTYTKEDFLRKYTKAIIQVALEDREFFETYKREIAGEYKLAEEFSKNVDNFLDYYNKDEAGPYILYFYYLKNESMRPMILKMIKQSDSYIINSIVSYNSIYDFLYVKGAEDVLKMYFINSIQSTKSYNADKQADELINNLNKRLLEKAKKLISATIESPNKIKKEIKDEEEKLKAIIISARDSVNALFQEKNDALKELTDFLSGGNN